MHHKSRAASLQEGGRSRNEGYGAWGSLEAQLTMSLNHELTNSPDYKKGIIAVQALQFAHTVLSLDKICLKSTKSTQ